MGMYYSGIYIYAQSYIEHIFIYLHILHIYILFIYQHMSYIVLFIVF